MSFVDGTIDFIEEMSWWVSSMFKQHMSDYINVETKDSQYTLALKDGSLMTIVRMEGSRQMVGADEFKSITTSVNSSLETYVSANGGHAIQVFFGFDKTGISNHIRNMYAPSKRAAEAIGISIDDLVEDRVTAMSVHCHLEDCFYVLRTRLDAISKSDLARSVQKQKEAYAKKQGAIAILAQNPIIAIDALRDRHNSFVSSFCSDMFEAGLIVDKLDAHTACREIRKTIDPDFTSEDWQPSLAGDKLPLRQPYVERDDISNILWPKLSSQLTPRNGRSVNHQFYSVGNRMYATIAIDLPPKDPKVFNVLFKRMLNNDIPWRMSMNIESGGLRAVSLKKTFAAILGFAHSGNAAIVDAYKELDLQVRKAGAVDARFSTCFTTWVDNNDIAKLGSRVSMLARAVEGWGICDVNEIPGDSATGFMTTVLGQTSEGCAVPCAANLRDVVNMLPVTRSASPWNAGSIIYRTPDGKLWPYQPGSSKQVAWIDLFFAGMGSGKSVQMNNINLALCSDARIKRLPRISILDIGPTSEGLILLLKDQLPEGRKHEAAYHRLRMREECAINPFDTVLGNRFPIASHRAFLTNFVMLLTTPVGKTEPYDGLADMIGLVIDETYNRMSDNKSARAYSLNTDAEVDEALSRLSFEKDKQTTWWEVVDFLFQKGETRIAALAQRYAVPLLDDLIETSQTPQIKDVYKMKIQATQETPSEAFQRMISSATREYLIISRPTRFDISEARVVSLDLDEVAKTGGEAADRQTSIMYMLARFVLARDFYLVEDNLPEINESYRAYHRARVKESAEDIKRICLDEFHRTSKAVALREQIVTDIREGRKWGVHVALASQNLDDFDEIMISLATNIFIMGKFDQKDVEDITARFGLSDTAKFALVNSTHGPRAGIGATFLVNMKTTDSSAITTQIVTSTIGPIEYWAFSTTAEDKILRSMVYNKIGGVQARKLLSRTYPWGIKSEVERRADDITEGAFTDDKTTGIIDQILNEVMDLHYKESRLVA